MNVCEQCQGLGHIALRGDNDQICPQCNGTGNGTTPAPVSVTCGAYVATVEFRGPFVHLSCKFLHHQEKLTNVITEPNYALAIGRALVVACRPTVQPKYFTDWDYSIDEKLDIGCVLLQLQQIPLLPDTLTRKSGYELGHALIWVGALLGARREIATWLGKIDSAIELAV